MEINTIIKNTRQFAPYVLSIVEKEEKKKKEMKLFSERRQTRIHEKIRVDTMRAVHMFAISSFTLVYHSSTRDVREGCHLQSFIDHIKSTLLH